MLTDEYRYRILKLLEGNPSASQRDIARELGVSLGRVNYCLQALAEKGLIKVNNFRQNESKRAYLYYLTPKGMQEKTKVTVRFLKAKLDEYENLKLEVAQLQREANKSRHPDQDGAFPVRDREGGIRWQSRPRLMGGEMVQVDARDHDPLRAATIRR